MFYLLTTQVGILVAVVAAIIESIADKNVNNARTIVACRHSRRTFCRYKHRNYSAGNKSLSAEL